MAEVLAPTDAWAIWHPSHGYRGLARYVSPRALNGHGLSVSRTAGVSPEDDVAVAKLVFERLSAKRFQFAEADWTPHQQGRQPIRHPGWIASEGGNCLDLSVTFAAMCLRAGIAPLLAVTEGHAFVLLRPNWLRTGRRGEPIALEGARQVEDEDPGELQVEDPEAILRALGNGALIGVDCVGASRGRTFDEVQADAAEALSNEMHVIDVPYLQDNGLLPLEAPLSWPSIQRYPPGKPEPPTLFAEQRTAAAELRELRAAGGLIVAVHAESGHGKSTVARDLLTDLPNDAAWFLDASDPQALVDSLADAELAAQGIDDDGNEGAAETAALQRADRDGYAFAALDRLRRAATPWVVVFDNADLTPAKLESYLPDPGPGQIVVVTTTEPLWRRRAEVIDLGPVAATETEAELGSDALTGLVGGRPLLMSAFAKLMAAEGLTPAQVAAGHPTDGPAAFWAALRPRLSAEERGLAAIAAHLPPDRIPHGLVERLAGAPAGTVARLATRGLFSLEPGGRRARLHRLLGAAIRADVDTPGPVALRIAGDAEAAELLSTHGDRGTAQRLLHALRDQPATDGFVTAAANLSAVLELRGDAAGCAEAYALVEPLLDDRPEHRRHRAGMLFALARQTNRAPGAAEARQRAALEQARAAYAIIEELGEPSGRYLALIGLLERGLAQYPLPGESTPVLLDRAHRTLMVAYRLRADLGDEHPERIRAYFNLAGLHVRKAQVHVTRAGFHLDKAEHIYADVANRRHVVFRTRHHAQIATCIQGLGYVWYYRALFVAETRAERSAMLREATAHTLRALGQWEVIEAAEDEVESTKAANFLAKVALARSVHRTLQPRVDGELAEAARLEGLMARTVAETLGELCVRYS